MEKLEVASKWAAGGFSAASALLLFFGIKEGVLDQAVRLNPFATLCVFMLLGVGVLSALFAGAIEPVVRIHLWTVIAAVAVMVLLTALFLPNLEIVLDDSSQADSSGAWKKILLFVGWIAAITVFILIAWFVSRALTTGEKRNWVFAGALALALLVAGAIAATMQTLLSVATGIVFVVAIAWSFTNKAALPAIAGIVLLGVAATSLGLYGAAKLSVGSKVMTVNPQVTASFEQADGRTLLKIAAVASRMRGKKLLITVAGVLRKEEAPLSPIPPRDGTITTPGEMWQGVLEPNSLDEVDTTVTVPLTPTRWEFVTVSHCRLDDQQLDEVQWCADQQGGSQALLVRNPMPEAGAEITGHIVATSAKSLQVTLTGRSVAWGTQLHAEICRVRRGDHALQLAYATLTPDAAGAVAWNVPVPAGADGDGLVLRYQQCPRGTTCTRMTKLAKYALP